MSKDHIRFSRPRVRCIQLEDIFRDAPVRCRYLKSSNGMYSCRLWGFPGGNTAYSGKIRELDNVICYDFDRLCSSKTSEWNFCFSRLGFFLLFLPTIVRVIKDIGQVGR